MRDPVRPPRRFGTGSEEVRGLQGRLRPYREPEERPVQPSIANEPVFSGDRAVLTVLRQMAVEPDAIPRPPLDDPVPAMSGVIVATLAKVSVACAAAALLAWVIVSVFWTGMTDAGAGHKSAVADSLGEDAGADQSTKAVARPSPEGAAQSAQPMQASAPPPPALAGAALQDVSRIANLAPRADQPAVTTVPEPPATDAALTPAVASASSSPLQLATASPNPELPPSKPPIATQQPAPPNTRPEIPNLDPDQISTLLEQGKDFLANGDFAAARLLFQRAADAGSADGALELGSTFDPSVIKRLQAVNVQFDIKLARKWYERAMELGSTAAALPLANLAHTTQQGASQPR